MNFLIPDLNELMSTLDLKSTVPEYSIFSNSLLNPIDEFLKSGGKKFRDDMIQVGFDFFDGKKNKVQNERLNLCSQIIEGLHSGSMIIDDIQDQSELRRGNPTLHRKYGTPVALNAGNWLYFQSLSLVERMNLNSSQEVKLLRYLNKTLIKAHFGQAIDVGTPMALLPKEQVISACFTSMELKTGALMSLAFDLGAFIARPQNPLPTPEGSQFGSQFGIALQMFDDIGNFTSLPPKGKEDLKNGRPSFIWSVAAKIGSEVDYKNFILATQLLPNDQTINSWAKDFNLLEESTKQASSYLWNLLKKTHFPPHLKNSLTLMFNKLERAYA